MWVESSETVTKLRSGLTTGSCATACCVAAGQTLLANLQSDVVSITLPKGKTVEMAISAYESVPAASKTFSEGKCVRVSVIKDAGDDPDVTHGATVFVDLSLCDTAGVSFFAGEGVGTVTREGLALPVGEPAINVVPRRMMTQHLEDLAAKHNYSGGFLVSVGVKNGETIALKTMNGRLGIIGGLSILGTTGIVRPFSCAAWIASIHQGIDVASANGVERIAASTGNSSEAAIKAFYQMDEMALIEMGDFAGAVLKHLKKKPIKQLSICGGIGKISKLANGHMDLNSRVSAIDFEHMASVALGLGGDEVLKQKILTANTSVEVLKICQSVGIDLAFALCEQALVFAKSIVPAEVSVEVSAIDRQGNFVGSTNPKIMSGCES